MVLTTQEIDHVIAYSKRHAARAEKFLARLEEETKCEICYERLRSCGYQCQRHQVCKECFARIVICPFCRAPQMGAYPDLWYCDDSNFSWIPLTEDAVRNGLRRDRNAERFSSPTQYALWLRSACEAGVVQLESFERHPASIKMVLRVVADCVNRRANYPIFAWHKQQHLHYCADRWRMIQDAIIAKTDPSPELEPELRRHMKKSLCKLLKKIKDVAAKAGLAYRHMPPIHDSSI
jgi:hypothetical protein